MHNSYTAIQRCNNNHLPMTTKHERELRKAIDQAGLDIARWDRAGSGNIALLLRAPNGQAQKFFCSPTSGDPHAAKNNAAAFRKFAQANPAKQAPAAAAPAPKPAAAQVSVDTTQPAPTIIVIPTPATTPATTMPKPIPKTTKSQLSHQQFFKLCEWTKTANFKGVHFFAEASRRATAGVGFSVSDGAIKNALEATGIKLEPAPNRPVQKADGMRILARELVAMMEDLGRPVPDDLAALAKAAA